MSISGKANDPIFEMKVTIGNFSSTGIGNSKKKAKHSAAYKMILILNENGKSVKHNQELL